jgi:putative PIN family toxin of toxin-antitoxin system
VRAVLDTNILVRANPKTHPERLARDLLLKITSGPHGLILSEAILTEVRRVLTYPNVQARWPLTQAAIDQYLLFLEGVGEYVGVPPVSAAIVRDPDDDPILRTAISGQADVLCTRDSAFRHRLVEEACRAHGIRVLDDITLMQELRGPVAGR